MKELPDHYQSITELLEKPVAGDQRKRLEMKLMGLGQILVIYIIMTIGISTS